jgi:hypothetical protein
MWKLERDESGSSQHGITGKPERALKGHGHFISDVVMSSDGQFALTGQDTPSLGLEHVRINLCLHFRVARYISKHCNTIFALIVIILIEHLQRSSCEITQNWLIERSILCS